MNTMQDLQEMFDSQVAFSPFEVGILLDFNKLWEKFSHETNNQTFSGRYYEEAKTIAEKYGLKYDVPKKLGNLSLATGVGSPTVLH